ncbi:DUF5107 domain-containing protein [Danxiaibacter flavus]|uniref:DUF5107 domain-containing protein n=1 Tax=Danxiaibacter flavus TaxID=3049108 RepID=A0ABV3Z9L9_9BACT|nr:DUF5107 domain-containing protein [Chitinophagaceae bacterium DXS]
MRKLIVFWLTCCGFMQVAAQHASTVKEYKKAFTTYPFSDPNPIPLLNHVYPYFRYDGFTDKAVQKEWKVVELENDYIKVMILPEIGGKIWAAIEKSTGQPFFYYNHAIKFRDVAMRGPWTSGGLEANYGIIGHTPNCATPVDYVTRTNADGSVSCIIGVLDLLTRSNWRMEINLPKDKAYFSTKSFWYNSTPLEQPYYHWMNGGIKAAGNLEFIYLGTKYIGHGGEYADWPVNKANGKKINFYEENNFGGYKSYHVFGKYTDFFGAYWHDDDFGMARYGTHDDKAGKKIWIWGLSRQGMIWDKLLTDTDGQYVEVQSGRLFNQNAENSTFTPFKHRSFSPYATDVWTEYWYPVLHTKGFVEANEYGALNLKHENGWLKIYFSPVQTINDTLQVKDGDNLIYNKVVQLSPLKVFVDSIKISANENKLVATLGGTKLVYESAPEANVLSRPVDTPKDFDWNSAYGLFLQGKELMDQKMFPAAEEKLKKSLEKDHNYLPALVKMAELLFRNMRYTEALELAKRALSIDTHAGDANYYYGLVNAQLGNVVDAKDGFDIAALSPEYRSAAYTALAKVYLKEKNADKALMYAIRAVDYNRFNIDALQMQAVIFRQLNNKEKENEVLSTILGYDPLNHFASFEKYLLQPTSDNKANFVNSIRNELPQETFAELAVWYYNVGCIEEAKQVFTLSPASAEASYWLAYLTGKKVDAGNINPNLAFPFRSETAAVLEDLLKNQNDWLLKYHLALIYKDRNRIDECKKLLAACGREPSFAPFYVVRAGVIKDADAAQSLADLQKAASLDAHWRYQKLLAEYYIARQEYEKALAVTSAYYKADPNQYIMGMLYAKTLLLNKQYAAADDILTKLNVIPFEGATEGRELYREAKLMQAVQLIKEKKYKQALIFVNKAKEFPENLGVGKPYDADIDVRLEDWLTYLCLTNTGKKNDATALLQKITSFEPKVDNTVRNFMPSNAIITAWAYEKLGEKEKGLQWLNDQLKAFPENKLIQWSKDIAEGKASSLTSAEKDAGVRVIEAL